jgi:hypothetical protein
MKRDIAAMRSRGALAESRKTVDLVVVNCFAAAIEARIFVLDGEHCG